MIIVYLIGHEPLSVYAHAQLPYITHMGWENLQRSWSDLGAQDAAQDYKSDVTPLVGKTSG